MDNQNTENYGNPDILSQLNNNAVNRNTQELQDNTKLLNEIHQDLEQLLRSNRGYSQGNFRDRMYDYGYSYRTRNRGFTSRFMGSRSYTSNRRTSTNGRTKYSAEIHDLDDVISEVLYGFGDSIRDVFDQDEIFKDIKKQTQKDLRDIANKLNVEVSGIPRKLGKELATSFLGKLKLTPEVTNNLAQATEAYYGQFQKFADNLKSTEFGSKFADIIPDYDDIGKLMGDALRSSNNVTDVMKNFRTGNAKVLGDIIHKVNGKIQPEPDVDLNDPPTQGEVIHHSANGEQEIRTPNGLDAPNSSELQSIDESVSEILAILNEVYRTETPQYDTNDQDISINEDNQQYAQEGLSDVVEDVIDIGGDDALEGALSTGTELTVAEGAQLAGTGSELVVAGEAGAGAAAAGLGGLGEAAMALAPELLAILGPIAAIGVALVAAQKAQELVTKALKWSLGPAIEGTKKLFDTLKKTTEREFTQWAHEIDTEQARYLADVETMVRAPFEIMQQAAKEWYAAWDSNLKMINQTQGYTKADLQNLMGSFADRLRSEGLTRVVSAADISSNLGQVLSSGLSGKIAEEFAYQATVLNNAVPTQDFFQYASTYASIAANAQMAGASMDEAIQEANAQLNQFASNVLYAGRELSGGFSTGLQNASDLFADSVRIANSAGVSDSSQISGVLTSVSAVVGAVAPDLTNGIVDSVVNAALGGNSPEYTALRSLSGAGASNSAFLKAFANDPQAIFSNIFENLGQMQQRGTENFMEVAESLSKTFGISMESFSRIDFEYLADAVEEMQVNDKAIDENMELLASGQSTTNQEQMKMAEINETILDEGLSYVLDNQAARAIQQHLWDQEIANELKKNEFAVNIRGDALSWIETIMHTAQRIADLVNPIGWAMRSLNNIGTSIVENMSIRSDIEQMLELGKVGVGNLESLRKLTTYNASLLKKETSLIERMGGFSATGAVRAVSSVFNVLGGSKAAVGKFLRTDTLSDLNKSLAASASSIKSSASSTASSMYSWNQVGKSLSNSLSATKASAKAYDVNKSSKLENEVNKATRQEINAAKFKKFIDTIDESTKVDFKNPTAVKTYEEWKATASKYGIKDVNTELSKYGITEETLRGEYESRQTAAASQYEWERENVETQFWDQAMDYFDKMLTNMDELMNTILRQEWMETRWDKGWIEDSWNKNWLETAWQKNWLDDAWQANWLDTAWQANWLDTAWQKNWLETAWQANWLNTAWDTNWLKNAWNTEWLSNQWKTEWLANQWKTEWLTNQWKTGWLTDSWKNDWLGTAWQTNWIDNQWKTEWLENQWKTEWLANSWDRNWINKAWNSEFLNQKENGWKTFSNAYLTRWLGKDGNWAKFIGKKGEDMTWRGFSGDFRIWTGEPSKFAWKTFFNSWKSEHDDTQYLKTLFRENKGVDKSSSVYKKDYNPSLSKVKKAEGQDLVTQLAETLTNSQKVTAEALADPTVQTNVLLSKILLVLQQLRQAENNTGGATLATSLSGLSLLKA